MKDVGDTKDEDNLSSFSCETVLDEQCSNPTFLEPGRIALHNPHRTSSYHMQEDESSGHFCEDEIL